MKFNIYLLFFLFWFVSFKGFGQENLIYQEIDNAKKDGIKFNDILAPFTSSTSRNYLESQFKDYDEVYSLNINLDRLKEKHKSFTLSIPYGKKTLNLELLEVPDEFYSYIVRTSDGKSWKANSNNKHYRGIIQNDTSSIVAISISDTEIQGLISTNDGNINIVKNKLANDYIIYNEKFIVNKPKITCSTVDDGTPNIYNKKMLNQVSKTSLAVNDKCVRIYLETEFDMFQALGSVSNVESFVSGLFNQVSILYYNENITTLLSEIFIWTTADPYTGATTATTLNEFQATRTSINGTLGQLLTFRDIGGGRAAGFSGLCNSSTSQKLSVSMLFNFYTNVPNYSWSVYVITHELGHLLGSRHTHACVWNGNNTAIDGCAGETEGGCGNPGLPATNNGTIMSYCHLQSSVGINFNLGFGIQPGAVIRNNVLSASCIDRCYIISGDSPICSASGYSIANVPPGSTVNWSVNQPGVASVSGNGSTCIVTPLSSNAQIELTLSATISNNLDTYTVTRTIWLGVPLIYGVNFSSSAGQGYFCTNVADNILEIIPSAYNSSGAYDVQLLSYPSLSLVYSTTVYGDVSNWNYLPSPGWYVMRLKVKDHPCGTTEWTEYEVEVVNCSGGFSWNIFPNPSDTYINIENKDYTSKSNFFIESNNDKASIINNNGDVITTSPIKEGKSTINTSTIKEGNYFLHIIYGKTTEKYQIIIKH